MAVHHPATIVPTKQELLQAWVPRQPWLGGADASALTRLGSYRFDDPDDEVGVETHLLGTADGRVLQVPLTYRGAPVPGAEDRLVTTMTHTTLGARWVYDGCHDPVYLDALVRTVLTGGREADLYAATEHGLVLEPATTHVHGSGCSGPGALRTLPAAVVTHDGATTTIVAGVTVTLPRVLPGAQPGSGAVLRGTWPGQPTPVVLATVATPP